MMCVKLSGRSAPDEEVEVRDFDAASAACRAYIEKYGLGNDYTAGGDVFDAAGKHIAWVSYNGRVWNPSPWRPGKKPIQEASTYPYGELDRAAHAAAERILADAVGDVTPASVQRVAALIIEEIRRRFARPKDLETACSRTS